MSDEERSKHFIEQIIEGDIADGKHGGKIVTRFPPEPNGYLHIGHAKSICLNFGMAAQYNGICHLRFDDTNPEKEDIEYVDSIQEDIRWLGFDWGENQFYASSYFGQLYDYATQLIEKGLAYICDLDADAFNEYRGTPTEPGTNSPCRDRSIEESLDLFKRMKAGEFDEGSYVLRAKINMQDPNIHMRDPVIYRIRKVSHHQTGDEWCIYPMYDFAHCLSDYIEGITHSICTLEFEVHRPLYDWILDELGLTDRPHQYEFARLNLNYTVMSKRKLLQLVEENLVDGWDDPRMPTVSAFRRRGYTPSSIRNFCKTIGVTKYNGVTDIALLEHCIRDELNETADRRMAVLDPIKVVITNYPEGESDTFDAANHPKNDAAGTRPVRLTREVYIERDDFMEDPPKKFFRLGPGREVRLRYACYITCTDVIKDDNGEVTELHCTWDPESKGGSSPDGRKVKGTIHWVSAEDAVEADVHLYDRLFKVEAPDDGSAEDFKEYLNPDSTKIVKAYCEPALADCGKGVNIQFERLGFFVRDFKDDALRFNRTATLRDSWAKK